MLSGRSIDQCLFKNPISLLHQVCRICEFAGIEHEGEFGLMVFKLSLQELKGRAALTELFCQQAGTFLCNLKSLSSILNAFELLSKMAVQLIPVAGRLQRSFQACGDIQIVRFFLHRPFEGL